jgi:hypothetical protein
MTLLFASVQAASDAIPSMRKARVAVIANMPK